jgi:hypothetical protein
MIDPKLNHRRGCVWGFAASPPCGRRRTGNYGVVVVPLPPKSSARSHWKSNGRKELKSELNKPVNMGCFSGIRSVPTELRPDGSARVRMINRVRADRAAPSGTRRVLAYISVRRSLFHQPLGGTSLDRRLSVPKPGSPRTKIPAEAGI